MRGTLVTSGSGYILRMFCNNFKLKNHLKFNYKFNIDDITKFSLDWKRKNG